MTHFSEQEWQRLRADFEARASQYHDLTLSVYYVVRDQPQPEVQFAEPNHAVSLWQFFGHLTSDESIQSLGPLEPTQFGMAGAMVSAFAVIAGPETDLFRRMAERAGSLVPDEVGQRITLEVASRFFDADTAGKPLYVCNQTPLSKWLNLVLVAIATHQPNRFQKETLAVDPFAASLVALDFLRHKLPALEPAAGKGLIPVAIQQIAREVRSLAMNLHCCNQDLKAEQSTFLMQRVNEQLLRIEALLPHPLALADCDLLARGTLQQLTEWVEAMKLQLRDAFPPFRFADLGLLYAAASKLDRHADTAAQRNSVAPAFTEYQRQQLQEKYGATEYLRRRWADEPDNAVERINAGMEEALRRFPEMRTWTVDDWTWLFFCDTDTVRQTAGWRSLDPTSTPQSLQPKTAHSGSGVDGSGEAMSKDATREFLMKVGALKSMLNERARGGTPSETEYAALRNELVTIDVIREALPNFVLTCHTIQDFWLFIQPKFAKYNERTEFLWQEFSPIMTWLQGGVVPGTQRQQATHKPDIVLVTVNKHETRAVVNAFAAATGAESIAVPVDDRVYHNLGTLNGTTIYHAISEMGSGGPGGMQQTVDKAIRSLAPGAVIAIGIAFGMDEAEQAIGDILISKQLRLYELQRIGKNSQIVLRGSRPDAATRLLNHFRGFVDTKWEGASVTSGVMLTGEKLVDDIDYRKQLQAFESEAIGGEMEGAGLYVAGLDHKVDWIVVKAICDFADGNKGIDKTARQKLAAQNAAEFVVQALRYAPLKRR